MQALDMPASSVRSFVMEGDVIPRAMLSSDPSFTLLKRWSVVRAGLQLRETLFGSGVPLSPSRFFFDSIGDVLLVRWDAKTGTQVVQMTANAVEAEMQRATDELLNFDGQRLMQAASDIYLGWTRGPDGRHYYWRQLRDMKGAVVIEEMTPLSLALYARGCGWTLARAHARTGDPVAIAAYLGQGDAFDRSVLDFAVRYADQNERDYAAFAAAVRSGQLEAAEGV